VVNAFVMDYTARVRGSISAERGVGLQKNGYLKYSKTTEMIVMKTIKQHELDPKGILNPYKLFP
jgi:FAD/FMN-containing dehydrogenase